MELGQQACISEKQADPDERSRYKVFTDAAKSGEKTGAAYSITHDNVEIDSACWGMPGHTTVLQAELAAIEKALKKVQTLKEPGAISIHTIDGRRGGEVRFPPP